MKTTTLIQMLALTLLSTAFVTPGQSKSKVTKAYNVLFISIDDLRTELNCYGAEHITSPNMDRLAAEGIRFTGAHVQQAICMASRASIMSGIRPEKHGIYTGESVTDMMPDVLTLNKFFKQHGYTVSTCGKIYHYAEDTEVQFGDDYMKPETTWVGRGYVTEEAIKIREEDEDNYGPAYECGDVEDDRYKDGANAVLAIDKLAELKASGTPFFMAVGFSKPHLPFVAPKTYWDLYPAESITLSELTERPGNGYEKAIRPGGELSNYALMPKSFADIDDEIARTLRRAYYACVSYTDAQVGKVLDQLDALGLRENTIVVFWGDHGYKLGDYGSWCKWSNMNMDTNIPFIFSVPNGKKGEVCNQMVEALDIYPTLADLCELDLPEHLEGKSLKPQLNNPALKSDATKYAYSIWPDARWIYDRTTMGYSVKTERFNYVEWVTLSTGEVLARELFDHANDPRETKNVMNNPEYAPVVARLARKCQLRKDTTDHDHAFKKLR